MYRVCSVWSLFAKTLEPHVEVHDIIFCHKFVETPTTADQWEAKGIIPK